MSAGSKRVVLWGFVGFALIPLSLLMFSGLYLFALPYAMKWRARAAG